MGCCCRGRLELICECMETALRCDHALCHRRARETLGGERYIDRERVSRTRLSVTRRVIGQTTVHFTQLTTYGYNHCSVGHFSLLSWVYPAYTRTGSLSLSLSSRVVVFSLSHTHTYKHSDPSILPEVLQPRYIVPAGSSPPPTQHAAPVPPPPPPSFYCRQRLGRTAAAMPTAQPPPTWPAWPAFRPKRSAGRP